MGTTSILLLVLTSILPLTGALMAVTPFLMKKGECFAVTIPESAVNDPVLRGYKRAYTIIMLIATALFTVVCIYLGATNNGKSLLVFFVVTILLLCLGGYGLMLFYRQKVVRYKKQQNWIAESQEAVAALSDEEVPGPISIKWNLLQIPIILITLLIGIIGYSQIPDQVVMQVDFEGNPTNIVDKSPFVVLFPVLVQLFMAGAVAFSHWTITRSKREVNSAAPATSALAYGLFAHAQSICHVSMGLLMNFAFIMIPLSFMNVVSIELAACIVLILALIVVFVMMGISIVFGQGGSRLFLRMEAAGGMVADNDTYWKLGIFYWNPDDSNLFLPKRFGVGWTVNFARPMVWLLIGGFTLVTVAFVAVILFFG